MLRKDRWQKLQVSICILAYFLVWMESSHALPLFFVVTDDSHKAIVTEYRGQIHLTLHHPGNQDKHELEDGLSNIPAIVASGPDKHTDHEIDVYEGEQFISPMTKKVAGAKNVLPVAAVRITSVFINTALANLPADLFSRSNSTSVSPVLLI